MGNERSPWWAYALLGVYGLAVWVGALVLLAVEYPPRPSVDTSDWATRAVVFCTVWTLLCAAFAYGLGWVTGKLIKRDGTGFFGWVALGISVVAAYELRHREAGQALRLIPGALIIASLTFAVPLLLVLWATGKLRKSS